MPAETKDIIGLDVGLKRTGIARASNQARLAQPLRTVQTEKTVDTIKEMARKQPIEAVVVGLPRNLNGNETGQTKWVREWVNSAKAELKLPFFWQDEALTTQLAQQQGQTPDIDANAAAIIVQDFLDTPVDKRVSC